VWLGGVPGLQLPVDGFGVPEPAGESCPQCGDIGLAEPDVGESRIFHLVQPQSGIGEVLAGQARIQPPGKPIGWLAP
jgi:hypothetical protein